MFWEHLAKTILEKSFVSCCKNGRETIKIRKREKERKKRENKKKKNNNNKKLCSTYSLKKNDANPFEEKEESKKNHPKIEVESQQPKKDMQMLIHLEHNVL